MHKILSVLICVSLTGCASYNSSFSCKPGTGINCTAISKINKIVDRGGLTEKGVVDYRSVKKEMNKVDEQLPWPQVAQNDPSKMQRVPENTLKIWVAPYVSANDGYVAEQYLYEALEPIAVVK